MATTWREINDFMFGWGLKKPGVVTVKSEHREEGHIPYKIVSEEGAQYLYARDVKRL